MYLPNLKSVALPVPEIRGVAKFQSRGRGGHRGSGMVPFERALVSSYKPSTHIIPLSYSFARNFNLQFSVGVANPQFWRRGGRNGSGMVLFKRALVGFYRPSIVIFLYLYAFQRYCRFCSPACHFFHMPGVNLVSPKFPMFPW